MANAMMICSQYAWNHETVDRDRSRICVDTSGMAVLARAGEVAAGVAAAIIWITLEDQRAIGTPFVG